MKNVILCEDVLKLASSIESNYFDAIICDSPYNIGKFFGNLSDKQTLPYYIDWSKKWLLELERAIKPSGTGFIYGFDEILAHISVNLTLPHRWLTWHYTNKNTAKATFWQRSHESIIVFWKDAEQRIFNADQVREPYSDTFLKNSAGKTRTNTPGRMSNGSITTYNAHELGAMGRDVIKIPALAGGAGSHERIFFCKSCDDIFMGNKKNHKGHLLLEHPTQKPQALTEKLLKSCLPMKDGKFTGNVYIPFAGSGSECVCCQKMGVDFISSDINPEYVKHGNLLLTK